MYTTNDLDKAVEAIANREGYGAVQISWLGSAPGIAMLTGDPDAGGEEFRRIHFVRSYDGAEVRFHYCSNSKFDVIGHPAQAH